ncbi:hypothetical protein G6F62_011117 [Rhizopus arrhizus]|nr:hypothetical protein G6F23_005468 [Rhizopus arrhizus]KAG0791656.1 hypothetical protein G6F21_004918 [Rhizopus arrhizus]KAG0799164.1 hypothetical protein G6F22_003498 [Rhizopus arrhizus]KAG0812837.1 hypothetical protein G6F20_006037 [Rhizopus arrhizus]KAG0834794.1 hypothetical protein G6F18_006136 [Rhizopus arrhizus]
MQSKKSTNTTNPKSSITFDIKNAGIVGNSYTPTTFNNVAANYHPGRKGFYHFEEYDNHKANTGDESTVLQNNDERVEDDKDDEEDRLDRPTRNIHTTPSDYIASIGTWITSDETGLVQLCYIVGACQLPAWDFHGIFSGPCVLKQ